MAGKISTETIMPEDFDVKDHLWDSPFQNCEKETIARNLILLSKWNGNKWLSFTWEEYQEKCKHSVGYSEKGVLDGFVSDGLMKCEDGVYSIQDKFIVTLAQYVK